jgi:single-strand DNA-binding protein
MLQITAVGNLAADPELKTVGDREVANFTLMVNKKVKGEEHTTVLRCAVWGPRAKVVDDYLTKGSQVTVTGQAYIETFERKDGSPGASLDVAVNDFTLPARQKAAADDADMPF